MTRNLPVIVSMTRPEKSQGGSRVQTAHKADGRLTAWPPGRFADISFSVSDGVWQCECPFLGGNGCCVWLQAATTRTWCTARETHGTTAVTSPVSASTGTPVHTAATTGQSFISPGCFSISFIPRWRRRASLF